jgi:hypothetical protein
LPQAAAVWIEQLLPAARDFGHQDRSYPVYMETEQFAQLFARQGYRTVKTKSSLWYEIHPLCWQSIPYHKVAEPSAAEIRRLFFKHFSLLIRFFSESRHGALPGHMWVCDCRDYDFAALETKTRNQVRRGLEKNAIEPVDFAFLAKAGWELIRDTAGRQARNADFARQSDWDRYCAAAAGIEDFEAWGAFWHGRLAAFLVGANVEGYYYILHQASRTADLKSYPNNALIYQVTKFKMRDPAIQVVSYGLDSVEDNRGLRTFKQGMGYYLRPINQKILINPLGKWLKSKIAKTMVIHLLKNYPQNNYLRKLAALLRKMSA